MIVLEQRSIFLSRARVAGEDTSEGLEGRSNGEMAAVWRGRVAQVARRTG